MASFVVAAPYVTPKVRDDAKGGYVYRGYYKDAVVNGDDIDPESLRHHLDSGLVEEVKSAEEPEPQAEQSAAEPLARPHGNASAAAWLDYAVSRRADGVSEEDARAELSGKTKAELVAEYGG